MVFTASRLEEYRREGFCLIPDTFSPEELAHLQDVLPSVLSEASIRRVVEKDGQSVRSVYGSHQTHETFNRLVRHPRLLSAAEAILGSPVYVYQFKINIKAPFAGDVWEWHQDYIFWREEDGMPTSRVVNVALYLDAVTEFNGPMFFIPRTHVQDAIDVASRESDVAQTIDAAYGPRPSWLSNLTADLKYSLPRDVVAKLAKRYGLVSSRGPAGSLLFFDANLVHASPSNVSPFPRAMVIVTYNSVENVPRPRKERRPEFLVSRDPTPLVALADDALVLPEVRASGA
jgi:hypothetical protein